jgi:hypothetical protein
VDGQSRVECRGASVLGDQWVHHRSNRVVREAAHGAGRAVHGEPSAMVTAVTSRSAMSECSGDPVTLVVTAGVVELRTDQLVHGGLVVAPEDEVMPAIRPLLGNRPAVRTKGA